MGYLSPVQADKLLPLNKGRVIYHRKVGKEYVFVAADVGRGERITYSI